VTTAISAPGEHRELFLAAYALLSNLRNKDALLRLATALSELDEHYGVESPADLQALEGCAA
jgi:hypothetical protein